MKLPEYKSLKEKAPLFSHIRIDTKDVLDFNLEKLLEFSPNCIFRGVNEAKYKIYTSVQRSWICNGLGCHSSINHMVDSMITSLRSNVTLTDYYKSLNVKPTDLLYLGLLQHYSAPSPLLDFTHDYKTALYFATKGLSTGYSYCEIDDYFSLYYIDIDKCGDQLVKMDEFLNNGLEAGSTMHEDHISKNPGANVDKQLLDDMDMYTKWIKKNTRNDDGLCAIKMMFIDNPLQFKKVTTPYTNESLYWSNLNIIAQNGCFILYNNNCMSMEEYISQSAYLPKISCIDIHKSLKEYVQKQYLQTLTELLLFPDINQIVKGAYQEFLENL